VCILPLLLLLGISAAHAQWTPSYLPTGELKNWYDASDGSTLWQDTAATTPAADGWPVQLWQDKSGNGNHLTGNSNPSYDPTYTAGVMNSLPVVQFAGNTMANLAPSMGNITNNFTVIGVFQVTSDSGWDNWVKWGNGDVGGGDLCAYLDNSARPATPAGAMEFAYDGGTGAATTNVVTGQPAFLFIGGVNQATSPQLFSTWMNGTFQESLNPAYVTTHSSSLTQFRIGPSTSYQKPHGNIAELIVVNTGTNTLSSTDRQLIEGYLANKWWGAGSLNPLPSGHPYKNAAPNPPVNTITATNGIGGTISPNGAVTVIQGNNQIFTIAPLTGYAIANVTVDSVSKGVVTSYTFTNVLTDHTIGADFTALSLSAPSNLVATAGQGLVALNWSAATGPLVSYIVESATNSGGPYSNVATLAPGITSYVDNSATNGAANYYYVVVATNYATSATSSEAAVNVTTPGISIAIQNNSFESGADGDYYGSDNLTGLPLANFVGWTGSNATAGHFFIHADGFAFIDGTNDAGYWFSGVNDIHAKLTYSGASSLGNLQPNTTYIVTLVIDCPTWERAASYTSIHLTANGTDIASFGASQPRGPSNTEAWSTIGAAFNTGVNSNYNGQALGIYIDAVNQSGASPVQDSAAVFDNVKLTASSAAGVYHSIIATNGIGGTISPSGTNSVIHGQNQTFNFTPLTGYAVANVIVDSVSKGAVSSYTFTNVVADHTIGASFTVLSLSAPTSVVATAGPGNVSLTWGAATGPVVGYNVERATNSGGPYTVIANVVSTSYVDSAVIGGTNYYYVISAWNYATSATSGQVSAKPLTFWYPSALGSNLVNWYDASDLTTLWQDTGASTPVTANGNTVLRWNDKSGNGNDLTSSSGPAYTTGVMNSLPVLQFAHNSMANLAVTMGNSTDNFTVIGVFKVASDYGWDNWIKWGNGDVGGGDLDVYLDGGARTTTPAEAMEFAYAGGTGAATTNAVTAQPAFLFIGGVNQAISPSLFSVWMNGGFQQAQNPAYVTAPCSSLTQFQIGNPAYWANLPKGNIAELLVVNTGTNTLSAADRQRLEGYLANKWWGAGTNNVLPSGHPYKNSAPLTTLPAPPAPVIPANGVSVAGGVVSLTFPTVSGYQYQVVYKNALTDATWQVVAPGYVTATSTNMAVTDSGAVGHASRFYRVEAASP
jgi:hypothetical protein